MENITKKAAREFWRDFRGTCGWDPDGNDTNGIMSGEFIAEKMGISPQKANALLWECVKIGLSDRSCGMFVV